MPKPPKRTYIFTVTDGKIKIGGRKEFDQDILAYEGHKGILTTEWLTKKKSKEQGGYLWAVVYEYALHGFHDAGYTEWTKDDVHKFFRDEYSPEWKVITNPNTGEEKRTRKTTVPLTATQMMTYIECIIRFCGEWWGIVIPPPDPLFNLNTDENE